MRVQIVLFDGFDELDVFGPFEPLAAGGADVELVRLGAAGMVTSARGVSVHAERAVIPTGGDPTDGVIVPGGGWLDHAPEGAWTQVQRGGIAQFLSDCHDQDGWIASVCSGGMIVAHAGLLAHLPATTNRACFAEFEPLVGELVDARVVDAGAVITAGALSCGLDLGIHLVRRFVGAEVADDVQSRLEYVPPSAGI